MIFLLYVLDAESVGYLFLVQICGGLNGVLMAWVKVVPYSQMHLRAWTWGFNDRVLGRSAGISSRQPDAVGRNVRRMVHAESEDSRPGWVKCVGVCVVVVMG